MIVPVHYKYRWRGGLHAQGCLKCSECSRVPDEEAPLTMAPRLVIHILQCSVVPEEEVPLTMAHRLVIHILQCFPVPDEEAPSP